MEDWRDYLRGWFYWALMLAGWTGMIGALLFLGTIAITIWDGPEVPMHLAANKSAGVLKTPTFTVTVWHQHPGNLRKGTLRVIARGPNWGPMIQDWSFEEWKPNRDAGTQLKWQLTEEQLRGPISTLVVLDAVGTKHYQQNHEWSPKAFK